MVDSFVKIARGIWNWQFFNFEICFFPFQKTKVCDLTIFEVFKKNWN
jgi:hypothetical protein